MSKTRRGVASALITAAALTLTACGSGDPATTGGGSKSVAKSAALPTRDVVSHVRPDRAAVALLPADVRKGGTLTLATAVGGAPPGTSYLPDGRTLVGQDIDFAEAAARTLGLKLKHQAAGFETILPALDSGKFDLGVGNFGVTDERRKVIDFVTYINDGQGFAVRKDSALGKVSDLTQLCGLKVATGAGDHVRGDTRRGEEAVRRGGEEGLPGPDVRGLRRALGLAPAGPQRCGDVDDQRPALRRRAAAGAEVPQ